MFELSKEWPVLLLMGGVVGFFAYVVFKSHQQKNDGTEHREKKGKDGGETSR